MLKKCSFNPQLCMLKLWSYQIRWAEYYLYVAIIWIIVSSGCRIGRLPPVVRTAVPVDGRFEHLVLSCNATSDHAIIWIERESRRALDVSNKKNSVIAGLSTITVYIKYTVLCNLCFNAIPNPGLYSMIHDSCGTFV